MIVVVHHCFLSSTALARAYGGPHAGHLGGWAWVLAYTPLHLIWAGPEAVFVFFVLSGLVLTVAIVDSRRFSWLNYYPRRLIRLYLPVIGSVVFAVVSAALVTRSVTSGGSWWLNNHHGTLTLKDVIYDLTLVRYTTFLNSPLWSLKWEVWFSLLLPLYVLVAMRARFLRPALFVLILAVVAYGAVRFHQTALYLPMFGLGVILALERDRLRFFEGHSTIGAVLAVGALAVLTTRWWVHGLTGHDYPALVAFEAAAAACLVALFATWVPARRLGEERTVQWLGRRSFSLYLVHEPIVVSIAILLGGRPNLAVELALAVPAALIVAHVFFRWIEGPSHRLAQATSVRRRTVAQVA